MGLGGREPGGGNSESESQKGAQRAGLMLWLIPARAPALFVLPGARVALPWPDSLPAHATSANAYAPELSGTSDWM